MIAASPLSGCPLVKPATQNRRWPSKGKGNTIGSTVGVIMNHWGVSPCYTNPPVATAGHRNDTNTHRNATESYPHPPNPPRPYGVTNVGPTTAIATYTHTTSQNHCSQDCRDIIGPCNAPGPDTATVWTCPTPVYTHTARRCTNNTQSQCHRAVCPSATHMSTM